MFSHSVPCVLLIAGLLLVPSAAPAGDVVPPAPHAAALVLPGGTDPLVAECPPTAKVVCGLPNGPDVAGEPTVSGGCPPYVVTYSDTATPPAGCPAERFVRTITRTFTITDQCGNTVTCSHDLHELKNLYAFDAHPTSCPNPLNRRSNGKFPAAILGSATLDVTTLIPETIQLYVQHCSGGPAIPIPTMFAYEDVATPFAGPTCGCTTAGPDGYVDLVMKFDTQHLVNVLRLDQYPKFTNVRLTIIGTQTNGCRFIGLDCIRVQ